MKKLYVLAGSLLLTASAFAQGNELFFSEYAEGAHMSGVTYAGSTGPSTGSEKAIEIFNPTISTVNLDPYSVRRYSNGSTSLTEQERLKKMTGTNTIISGGTFVYANGESTLLEIRNAANQFSPAPYGATGPNTLNSTSGSVTYFNGDDAVVLIRWTGATAGQGTPVIVDIFGVIGNKPTKGFWDSWEARAPGDTIQVRSSNQSLVRKPNIEQGIRNNPAISTYRIGDQWVPYSDAFTTTNVGDQSFADLGFHDYTGAYGAYNPVASVLEKFNNSISVFPVPASQSVNVKLENVEVSSLTILNSIGQNISVKPVGFGSEIITVDISDLKPGLYFMQCVSADGKMVIYKELVVR